MTRHKLAADAPWPGNMKLEVQSDGTSEGTRVFAVDAFGARFPVEGVTSVAWRLDLSYGEQIATATISLLATPADLATEAAPELVLERPERA